MTSRDWEKELAKIDRQLASMPDEEPVTPAPPSGTGMPRGVTASAARPAPAAGLGAGGVVSSGKARAWAFTKLGVAVVASVGIWFWPWPARCGLPLAGLMAAGAGVGLLGLWSAAGTWRHRMGRAHVLSLLAIVSGAVLVGREVLPRVGYAYETFDRPARWTCQATPPSASPTDGSVAPPGGALGTRAPGATSSREATPRAPRSLRSPFTTPSA